MDINRYDVKISRHALYRAIEKGLCADDILRILKNAEIRRFGKHGVKFINKGSKETTICVGNIIGLKIKIFTIEGK